MSLHIQNIPSKFGWHKCVVVTVDGNLDQPISVAFNTVGRNGATYHFDDEMSGVIEEGGCDYPNGILPPRIVGQLRGCLAYYNIEIVDETIGTAVQETITDILNHCLSLYGNCVADESTYGCTASLVFIDASMSVTEAKDYVISKAESNGGEQVTCLSTMAFLEYIMTEHQ